MREKILEVMQSEPKIRTLEEWASYFDLSSPKDLSLLESSFRELEADYEVVLSKKKKYVLASTKGIYKGNIVITKNGRGYLDFEDRASISISRKDLMGALNHDKVVVQENLNGNGKVLKILEHATTQLTGTIMGKRLPSKFIPDRADISVPVRITNDKEFSYPHLMKVQVRITEYQDKYLLAKIERILGKKGDAKTEIFAVLLENGVRTESPEEVIEEAKAIPQVVKTEINARHDLRNQLLVTIDGGDAKDLDDAVSIEKIDDYYRLGVHIADVSYYVKEGSPLDLEAYERGTSTYVADRVVPMLPTELSNGVCSLLPNVERYAVSCVMDINHQGEIMRYELYPSLIKTHAQMTYDSVNKILRGNKKECQAYEHLISFFSTMKELADILHKKREAGGSIDFEKDEAKIIVDENGVAVDIQLRKRGVAEGIIEEFMVCANECVARHMHWLQYPFVYRVHEKPSADRIREFAKLSSTLGYQLKGNPTDIHASSLQRILRDSRGKEVYPVLSSRMLRAMQKARYAAECQGHFGLGLSEYAHFTSPIRRYPDLIVHRMLYKYVFTSPELSGIEEDIVKMNDYAKQSSLRERVSIDAERDVEDMKKAEYMKQKIGREYEGMISAILSQGFFVQLENTVEGFVSLESLKDDYYIVSEDQLSIVGRRTKQIYRLGEKVKIKVMNADIQSRHIDFSLTYKKSAVNWKRK